ncbi:protein translocase subunit SecD [Chloracidobacterium sp. MS 40/45]|uniref:protein translocase subunit SecD n=1 Tax=Chloracidobacterium aggregatum TaxID=2851959 RepID=UPI001B8C6A31|nr:protein translocase subunit SecD [Chloracidobacterium aggregatum]QUW00065.1 protein translocase subunit SecD [Chloracidobacterium sp. MS 40/45]
MRENILQRALVILVVTLGSLYVILIGWRAPRLEDFKSFDQIRKNVATNIKLGLDLKGGSHLVMQVMVDEALKKMCDDNAEKAKAILENIGIAVKEAKSLSATQLAVTVNDAGRIAEARDKVLEDFGKSEWNATISGDTLTFTLNDRVAQEYRRRAVEQAMLIIENRINAFGVAEPTLQRYGAEQSHQILLQLPGVDDPERVKKTLVLESNLELRPVDGTYRTYATLEEAKSAVGVRTDVEALPLDEREDDEAVDEDGNPLPRRNRQPKPDAPTAYMVVSKTPVVVGRDLRDAFAASGTVDGDGDYRIIFKLKDEAAKKFGEWTGKNIGKGLAIVLNGRIKSAPTIRGQIRETGEITGNFTKASAEDLALVLRSGALPARIVYLEERTVGPSLGADSIRQGVAASIAGLVFILVFMVVYYRLSGINAIISLILNLVMLLAAMAMFGAVLTLPGIAGVILTIGMAVDSNVLIFERIREELRAGKPIINAVELGFDKAFITILDTHVTTVVSSLILFVFGTGPIRGFAVTLLAGLLANIFTATFVSKTMFGYVLSRAERPTALSI